MARPKKTETTAEPKAQIYKTFAKMQRDFQDEALPRGFRLDVTKAGKISIHTQKSGAAELHEDFENEPGANLVAALKLAGIKSALVD